MYLRVCVWTKAKHSCVSYLTNFDQFVVITFTSTFSFRFSLFSFFSFCFLNFKYFSFLLLLPSLSWFALYFCLFGQFPTFELCRFDVNSLCRSRCTYWMDNMYVVNHTLNKTHSKHTRILRFHFHHVHLRDSFLCPSTFPSSPLIFGSSSEFCRFFSSLFFSLSSLPRINSIANLLWRRWNKIQVQNAWFDLQSLL